jgi:hypothetical protein
VTIVEMAICDDQRPFSQSIGLTPKRPKNQLTRPKSRPNSIAKTIVAAATEVAYGMSIEMRKNVEPRSL